MVRNLFAVTLTFLTALVGAVVVAPAATAAEPIVMPSKVDIHSTQAIGGGTAVTGGGIRIKGQAFFLTAYQKQYSNVPLGAGTITISRQLAGEAGYTPITTVALGNYGIFSVDLPAIRNANYIASYSGWNEIRDQYILMAVGCDTPCDRLVHLLPSSSAPTFGSVTRQLTVGKPRAVGRNPGVYWKRMRRPYKVAVRVAPQYAGRLVTVERQIGCLGEYRPFTSVRIRGNAQGVATLRRNASYSCFRFSIAGDATFAAGSIALQLNPRRWVPIQ